MFVIYRKGLLKILVAGIAGLFMLMITVYSVKAEAVLTNSAGVNLVSGGNYKIMFGWGSTSKKNVYLTGNDFHSSPNKENAGLFKIMRPDRKVGLPIPQADGFIVQNQQTGQYWNFHSNTVTAYVDYGSTPVPYTHTLTTSDGSTFFTSDRNQKGNDGYWYSFDTGAYTLGYDWDNLISIKYSWETELFFE